MQQSFDVRQLDPTWQVAREARRRSQETLMNCYCREVAGPAGELAVGPALHQSDWPIAARLALQRESGLALHVQLPRTGDRLLAAVSGYSITGNFRYCAVPFFHKASGKRWALIDWADLASVLLREMGLRHGRPASCELHEQLHNSVAMTALALSHPPTLQACKDPLNNYIESEQSLVFGHPFHPAPKSRQGFDDEDLHRYSPELKATFPLHYFEVQLDDVVQRSLLPERCDQIVASGAPTVGNGRCAIPMHPWQARHMLTHPLITEAMASGRMRYLGEHGKPFHATSSVRTLYQRGNPYFYKFSLNVRLTNCVRKNAWYELEGAIEVSRIMRELLPSLQREFPGLCVLEEPAFLSIDMGDNNQALNREVVEGFGMILRSSLEPLLEAGATPVLSAALFGNHHFGESHMRDQLASIASREGCSLWDATERWFSYYVAQLMQPVLHCYFSHGLVFEPHLQNVVVSLRRGWPCQTFLRDFEGVKLLPNHYPPQVLSNVGERAREALWYDEELGWKRVAYCLFVNNFAEAIVQLAGNQRLPQQRLWSIVRHHLRHYQSRWGTAASARRIQALMSGEPLPGKTNLSNCFLQRADRASTYVPVGNPIATAEEVGAWN